MTLGMHTRIEEIHMKLSSAAISERDEELRKIYVESANIIGDLSHAIKLLETSIENAVTALRGSGG